MLRKSSLEPVTPDDCAFVVGIPDGPKAFLEAVGDPRREFARMHTRRQRPEEVACAYRSVARTLRRVCREASDRGVAVYRNASIDDLRGAIRSRSVVVVVGHFGHPLISSEDILDSKGMLDLLSAPTEIEHRLVAEHIRARDPELLAQEGRPSDEVRERLSRELESLVSLTHAFYRWPQIDQDSSAKDAVLQRLREGDRWTSLVLGRATRAALEFAFHGALRSGPSCELADRLHTIPEFLGCIDAEFRGVIDLSLCSSSILSYELRRRWREGVVIGSRQPVPPIPMLSLFSLALSMLQIWAEDDRPRSYQDAILAVEAYLREEHRGSEQERPPIEPMKDYSLGLPSDYGRWYDEIASQVLDLT